jgi:glycerophosphoryl diester phosphodiesterase
MKRFLLLFLLLVSNVAFAFDWQGHRGARGLYPEDTIGAMEEALKYPITTLEFDVVISKDNEVVVSHDPWMSAEICLTPDGKELKEKKFNLYQMTYSEIRKFDCGSKPHPRFPSQFKASVGKPLLIDLLDTIEPLLRKLNRNINYNIEIKSTPEEEKAKLQPPVNVFSDLVIKTLREKLSPERFTIQSFDWRVLKYLHEKYPEIKLVALQEEAYTPEAILKDLGFAPAVFSPYYQLLTPEHVAFFKKHQVKVIPWTVNTVAEMKVVKALGADGLITDYPNFIAEAEGKSCDKDHSYFEGKCVKVPSHAIPVTHSPGWECKKRYVQKHLHCTKIDVPHHAHLSEDEKTWECDEGFHRYRGTCKK